MKTLLKIIAVIGSAILIAKIIEVAIDVLYENYGKKYISAQTEE